MLWRRRETRWDLLGLLVGLLAMLTAAAIVLGSTSAGP